MQTLINEKGRSLVAWGGDWRGAGERDDKGADCLMVVIGHCCDCGDSVKSVYICQTIKLYSSDMQSLLYVSYTSIKLLK